MGRTSRDGRENGFDDGRQIVAHVVIPEAQDRPAVKSEMSSPSRILARSDRVLTTVQFDRDPRGPAGEIDDVTVDDELSGEARSMASQCRPEQALLIGRVAA